MNNSVLNFQTIIDTWAPRAFGSFSEQNICANFEEASAQVHQIATYMGKEPTKEELNTIAKAYTCLKKFIKDVDSKEIEQSTGFKKDEEYAVKIAQFKEDVKYIKPILKVAKISTKVLFCEFEKEFSKLECEKVAVKATKGQVELALLDAIIGQLRTLSENFTENADEILGGCQLVLEKLTTVPNFERRESTEFAGLGKYLGKQAYSYIPENKYTTTRKSRKAVTCWLIQGLESSDPTTKKTAAETVKNLISFYLVNVTERKVLPRSFLNTLLALSVAYHNNAEDKQKAEEEILEMWQGQTLVVAMLSEKPYNISFTQLT